MKTCISDLVITANCIMYHNIGTKQYNVFKELPQELFLLNFQKKPT